MRAPQRAGVGREGRGKRETPRLPSAQRSPYRRLLNVGDGIVPLRDPSGGLGQREACSVKVDAETTLENGQREGVSPRDVPSKGRAKGAWKGGGW